MANTTITHLNVRPGMTSEYFTEYSPLEDGDKLVMNFDNELTIDDVFIEVGESNVEYVLHLIYPASGFKFQLKSGSGGSFVLNPNDSNRNQWYRLPAQAKFEIETTSNAQGSTLKVLLIGR